MQRRVALVATGGTIAGTAAHADDAIGYVAGVLDGAALAAAVPGLRELAVLEVETLARLDSCDMDHATWRALGLRVAALLARDDIDGIVVTHGTDTLEETAWFLQRTVAATKPLVLTAAMRPATALSADGPQNLHDAVRLAALAGARGVLVAVGGRVHAAADIRKVHGLHVDAFSSGDAGALAQWEAGALRRWRFFPAADGEHAAALAVDADAWPWVAIAASHAGARGESIDALVAAGVAGIVVAGTGNGSVHAALRDAAARAQQRGVRVLRASRCILGGVVGSPPDALPSAGALTPQQARVELLLQLLTTPASA